MKYRYLTTCLGVAFALSACGSDGEPKSFVNGSPSDGNNGLASTDNTGECQTAEAFFAANVQSDLGICRTCHVSGGVGDVDGGDQFMLSKNSGEDFENLKASWEALGADTILSKAAGGEAHSGGAQWPQGSAANKNAAKLFELFESPDDCATGNGGNVGGSELPLLGSAHGGSPNFDFCQGKSDSTPLPPDPRSLVKPGVNKGKAVYYNAFWVDCHVDPKRVGEKPQPTTCGELRERVKAGAYLLKQDGYAVGAGGLFSGTDPWANPGAGFGMATMTAGQYRSLWKAWGGFNKRPDNFDELVGERYGAGFSNDPNPYPLEGEDPKKTNGGSGRLPIFFGQLKNHKGEWSGQIGISCHGCHSGVAGTAEDGKGLGVLYGSGSSLHDYNLFLTDSLQVGFLPSLAMIANLNRTRGTSNASAINLAFLFQQYYEIDGSLLGLLNSGSTAGMDTPAIWNLGHKTKKFVDGIFAADATRVDLVFYTPIVGLFGPLGNLIPDLNGWQTAQKWMKQHGQDANTWFESVKSPAYPFEVDKDLAEQGAVLFHSKNLWADALNNPVPKPEGGNGSCASCHGAYSPRFLNDPTYIDSPALEGIASFVVPLEVIGTDPVRVNTNNKGVQKAGSRNFFGYPETMGTDNDCGMQNKHREKPGYYAQPLYGIWATAPYFHNGSVPSLWEVLKPSDRKPLWRRVSKQARADQVGKAIMGYDTSLDAYDQDKVGWKYDVLECSSADGLRPGINCNPKNPDTKTALQKLGDLTYANIIGMWNVLYAPPLSKKDIEGRKIYNTHEFAMGNQGHEFTAVLTDQERKAIIEYLKTL